MLNKNNISCTIRSTCNVCPSCDRHRHRLRRHRRGGGENLSHHQLSIARRALRDIPHPNHPYSNNHHVAPTTKPEDPNLVTPKPRKPQCRDLEPEHLKIPKIRHSKPLNLTTPFLSLTYKSRNKHTLDGPMFGGDASCIPGPSGGNLTA